jgi:hypothetical protein
MRDIGAPSGVHPDSEVIEPHCEQLLDLLDEGRAPRSLDQHLGVLGAGLLQHLRVRREAGDRLDSRLSPIFWVSSGRWSMTVTSLPAPAR